MKKFIYIFIALFVNCVMTIAQNKDFKPANLPIDDETKLITYKSVVTEAGTKDELFDRGLKWFNKFYKNPADVIKEKNKETGKIKGIARMQIYEGDKESKAIRGTVEYTIVLECKEGRYRYTISAFNLKQTSYFPLEKWLNPKDPSFTAKCNLYLSEVDAYVNDLVKNLGEAMKFKEKKKDDW